LLKQGQKRFLTAELRAQGQGVDKQANLIFQVNMVAASCGRAYHNVFLAREAIEQAFHYGHQGHIQGATLLLAQLFQPIQNRGVELKPELGTLVGFHRRPHFGRGQFQHRYVARKLLQPVLPVVGLLFGQKLVLPGREVLILNAQWLQGRFFALQLGLIERQQFAAEHFQRPTVADEVVQVIKQHRVVLLHVKQGHAQQRAFAEVERGQQVLAHVLVGAMHLVGVFAQVEVLEAGLYLTGWQHILAHLLGKRIFSKGGTQYFVPLDELVQGFGKARYVDFQLQLQQGGHVVGHRGTGQLARDPQPVLAGRHGVRSLRLADGDGIKVALLASSAQKFQELGLVVAQLLQEVLVGRPIGEGHLQIVLYQHHRYLILA
jgi:hypothetical protein